ncbi:MAG: transposase InsO family protein [Candidatus Binatia bacterium]|jgi:transposase InsO family protein
MSIRGLFARPTKRFRKTTDSKHGNPVAPNLLQRRFHAEQPNQAWVADITYVRTWNRWLYLAVILDLHSRRVVGWAIAPHMRTKLVLDALQRAVRDRKPPAGMFHHSDRGSQYASADYRSFLRRHQLQCSMSRKGDCWDNAVAESFFSTLKTELIHRRLFQPDSKALDWAMSAQSSMRWVWPQRSLTYRQPVHWIEGRPILLLGCRVSLKLLPQLVPIGLTGNTSMLLIINLTSEPSPESKQL